MTSHSKAVIDACRPFAWKDKYPPTSALSQDEAQEIEAKWIAALRGS
jgi:4-hydroxy-3-polyprenylbenzoate decarboxylase